MLFWRYYNDCNSWFIWKYFYILQPGSKRCYSNCPVLGCWYTFDVVNKTVFSQLFIITSMSHTGITVLTLFALRPSKEIGSLSVSTWWRCSCTSPAENWLWKGNYPCMPQCVSRCDCSWLWHPLQACPLTQANLDRYWTWKPLCQLPIVLSCKLWSATSGLFPWFHQTRSSLFGNISLRTGTMKWNQPLRMKLRQWKSGLDM